MKILRRTCEDEMILNFLLGELSSNRFGEKLLKVLKDLNLNETIITSANLKNNEENFLRKEILGSFRGYGKNKDLFENFPNIKDYFLCEFSSEDLQNIFYINYSYWNELSNFTSSPIVAADNIKNNKVVYDVSNEQYFECLKEIEKGKKFTPLILLTFDNKKFIILEGHLRITAYSLNPKLFNKIQCFVLNCTKEDLKKWNGEV